MLTGEIRSQIDRIWDAFWSGGISNSLEVIEQITYLLFLKRLDELETAEELKLTREKNAAVTPFFPKGNDSKKRSYQDYRWKSFKNFEPRDMYTVVSEHVFPWLRTLGGNGTTKKGRSNGQLGLIARSLVGLDREAAKGAFAGFLDGKKLTANQSVRQSRDRVFDPSGMDERGQTL